MLSASAEIFLGKKGRMEVPGVEPGSKKVWRTLSTRLVTDFLPPERDPVTDYALVGSE